MLLLRALNDPEATKLYNLWSGGRIISDMMANSPEAQMERARVRDSRDGRA